MKQKYELARAPENLKRILSFLEGDLLDEYAGERLRPLKVEFSPYISKQLAEVAKTKGITEKEALRQLVEDDLKTMDNAEVKFKKMEERIKGKRVRENEDLSSH